MNPALALETSAFPVVAEQEHCAAPAARKPRVWTVFATFLVSIVGGQILSLLAIFVAAAGCGFVLGVRGEDPATIGDQVMGMLQNPFLLLVLSLIPFQIGMALVVVLAARCSKEPAKQRLGLVRPDLNNRRWSSVASLGLFSVAIVFLVNLLSNLVLAPPTEVHPVDAVLHNGSWLLIAAMTVLISILPGIFEEFLFRGYMQRRLLARWSPKTAIGVTAVLFALVHFDSLQHIIAVLPLGCLLGILAYRTGSTWPGVVVHAVHNALVVLLGLVFSQLATVVSETTLASLFFGTIVVFGAIGLPAVIALLKRGTPPAIATAATTEPADAPLSIRKADLMPLDLTTGSRLLVEQAG